MPLNAQTKYINKTDTEPHILIVMITIALYDQIHKSMWSETHSEDMDPQCIGPQTESVTKG